jgi:formate-dependent nitrite reductase membrane component NrfD
MGGFAGARVSTLGLPPQPNESDRGASRGDGLPAHSDATYYEQPLLKKPHWDASVIIYLFLGGLMGGSGMLVLIADDRPEREADLARTARYLSFILAAACPAVLVTHLGRPERFLHMMRIVKFKSVMSMGVWGLVAFSAPATAAAAGQLARDGFLPKWIASLAPRPVTNLLSGFLGAFIAGYTGVLLSATAIPVWSIGKHYIPAFSVCSGFAGACALNAALLAVRGTDRTRHKLERLELAASTAEMILLEAFRRHAGATGEPMFGGARGNKLRKVTQIGGIIVPAVLGFLPFGGRTKTLLASVCTLAGGYILRETLIEGGKASADDPRAASRQPE